MNKRKLTRQQRFRIDRIQKERVARAKKKDERIDELVTNDQLGEAHLGTVIAHFGTQIEVEDDSGQSLRCHVRSNLPAIVTGDRVIWHADQQQVGGVISALEERRTILSRPDYRGMLRPVAANVDRIIIVVSPSPKTPVNLIDRYLVATAHDNIKPIILLNKVDLLDMAPGMAQELNEYEAMGYQVVRASAKQQEGFQVIRLLVAEGNSVFVGQSGVGKSSIIQKLLPDEPIKVGEISEATGKGRHTTTTARLYHIDGGGQLIDSPGIREFGLWHTTDDDLALGFPEIDEAAHYCKFRNCSHTHEPGCAVKSAVDNGTVLTRRLESFHTIRDSIDEVTMKDSS
ncbi:MAG: small ribosomal subunit biogenesis GTPase RsgA [Reinekea sp.]|jgi:ribosome biogenesis GTPase / thiamine phosphate phosphatase